MQGEGRLAGLAYRLGRVHVEPGRPLKKAKILDCDMVSCVCDNTDNPTTKIFLTNWEQKLLFRNSKGARIECRTEFLIMLNVINYEEQYFHSKKDDRDIYRSMGIIPYLTIEY